MSQAAQETLSPQAFEGKDFRGLTRLISGIAIEKQEGTLVGGDTTNRDVVKGTPGRLARALLGESEVFRGDPIGRLEEAAENCGQTIGFAPEGSLETDERIQKATAVTAAALAVGNRMGRMDEVYGAYQRGYERGKRQRTIEASFVFPHSVKSDAVRDVIEAQIPEKPVSGVDIRTIFQDQLFHGKEKSVSLINLASRARSIYVNLSLRSDTKSAAAKVIISLFATKDGKDVVYDAELGLGSAKAMMAQWDTEVEVYKARPIEEWVSRPMLFEKAIRALHATGVYPKASLQDIRTGWAGKTLEASLRYLKRKGEVGETFHSPFRVLRRLSDEALRRIEKGGVSDLTFAQGLIGAIEKLYHPDELASYQHRLEVYKEDQLLLNALKAALSLRQLETRATRGEVTDAMDVPGAPKESGDFQVRISTYPLRQLESSIAWRSERLVQVKGVNGDTKELETQLTILASRRVNLIRLMSKTDLAEIAQSVRDREALIRRMGTTEADQSKRKAHEIEITALREAQERRILYFEGKTPEELHDSIVSREKMLQGSGLDPKAVRRYELELTILRGRKVDLDRLAGKTNKAEIEGSIAFRQTQLQKLGTSEIDLAKRKKLEIELTQLQRL